MQSTFIQEGVRIDYTPVSAVKAGQVVQLGIIVAIATVDIPAGRKGSLAFLGVFDVAKDASVFTAGDPAYWNATGNPNVGTAGTGCMTSLAPGNVYAGTCVATDLTGDPNVRLSLNAARRDTVRSIGASTAAAGTTTADAGVLPAGTAETYPTTGADGTKGVRVHALDQITGNRLFIGNGVANMVLKVYPPSGGTINGGAADAAFSSVSGKGVIAECLSGAGNTWIAW